MRQLWLAMVAVVLAGTAQAGPWLRAAGEGFLSFSIEAPLPDGSPIFSTTHLQYGLNDDVTLGFDLAVEEEELYKAVAFAKIDVGLPDATLKMAAELGVGVTDDDMILRPGLSLGRGFSVGDLSGWMTVDTLALVAIDTFDVNIKTDITVGLNTSERTKVLVQLQSGHHLMDPDYLKLAPSFIYERKPGQHIEIGALAGIENAEDFALKLGLWQKF